MSIGSVRPHRRWIHLAAAVTVLLVVSCLVTGSAVSAGDPKLIDKCQATLKKSGAKFVGKKLAALTKCTSAVFSCIQTIDDTQDGGAKRTACIAKARGGCVQSLGTIRVERQTFIAAVTKTCATLTPADVAGGSGLGYASLDCSEFGAPATDVTTMAACIAKQHECLASRIFQLAAPRGLEMIQFLPPDAVLLPAADLESLACLDDAGGTGTDVDDLPLGKAIVKCHKSIGKVAAKLAGSRLKSLEKCVDTLFTCAQTKSGDDLVKCREKAHAGCQKGFDKDHDQRAGLGLAIEPACGDAALFAALRTPAGGNLDALLPNALVPATRVRAAISLGCSPLLTVADYRACLLARLAGFVDDLVRFQAPRAESLLSQVGCGLGQCGGGGCPAGQRDCGAGCALRACCTNADCSGTVCRQDGTCSLPCKSGEKQCADGACANIFNGCCNSADCPIPGKCTQSTGCADHVCGAQPKPNCCLTINDCRIDQQCTANLCTDIFCFFDQKACYPGTDDCICCKSPLKAYACPAVDLLGPVKGCCGGVVADCPDGRVGCTIVGAGF